MGRRSADSRDARRRAEAGSPQGRLAIGHHAAAPGGCVRRRDGGAALPDGAAPRGEAVLLHDGAGRVAPHGGVAQARRGRRRDSGARPAPRPPRPHVPRPADARGEGVPDAGLLRAPDHSALPVDRALVARHGPRGPLQPADRRRRHPPRRRHGLRARAARGSRSEDEEAAREGGRTDAPDLRRARPLASARTGADRRRHGVARRSAAARGPRRRVRLANSLGLDVSQLTLPVSDVSHSRGAGISAA